MINLLSVKLHAVTFLQKLLNLQFVLRGFLVDVGLHHTQPIILSRNCENLLGTLLCERWNALSASTLSQGTGVLAGFGRSPAFHWDKWRRRSADSPMT